MIRVCHTWSSDTRIPSYAPFDLPVLARGFEVVHATPSGPNVPLAAARGVSWRELPMTRRLDPLGDARGILRLSLLFRREHFDIVHTHNAKVGLVGRLAATAARVPVLVHTVHGFPFHEDETAKRAAYVAAERIANVRTDAVFTQSEEDTATYASLRVIAPNRIHYVGNGVALGRFDPSRFDADARRRTRARIGAAEDDVLFVCASRLRVDKGIVELVRAAIAAREAGSKARLVLAGERDEGGLESVPLALLDEARRGGVLVLGHVDDIPALYAASDVVTLPSWHEGLPRALVEGAAMGKPLLTTNVPGCREVARAPMVATLVPKDDVDALRVALVAMSLDAPMRLAAAGVNRDQAKARFDVRVSADRIAAVYDDLLSSCASRIRR